MAKTPNVANQAALRAARAPRIAHIRAIAGMLDGADQSAIDKLSNDQVWAFMTQVEGDPMVEDDDLDLQRAQLVVDAEPETHDSGDGVVEGTLPVNIAAAHPGRARAFDAAAALAKSDDFEKQVTLLETSKEALSMGPLAFFDIFVDVYGGGDMAKAMVIINGNGKDNPGWPIAGTNATPKDGKPGSNNPDRFQISYSKGDGTSGTRQTSFFAELYDGTPHGKRNRDAMNDLERGDEATNERYARMHPFQRNQEKARLAAARNNSVNNLRRCRRIFSMLADVQTHSKNNIRVEIARVMVWDAKKQETIQTKELLNTPKPIIIGTTKDWEHRELFSIGSFLGFKPEQMVEKTLFGLKQTVKRKPKSGSGQQVDISKLPPLPIAEQQANLMLAAFDNKDWSDKFASVGRKPGAEATHAVFFGLYKELAYLYGPKAEFERAGSEALAAAQSNNTKATKAA